MKKDVQTARLELREILESDREYLIDLFTDAQVKQTYMLPDFADRGEAELLFTRIRELSEKEDRYVFAISYQGELIGLINDTEIEGTRIELGYALRPKYHNRGFATEALQAIIKHLFEVGFEEIMAGAFEENVASQRVMEKCGMVRISKTELIDYRGRTHLCVYYQKRRA